MIGLCIINKYSIYSQIAQSMFRLRKLNMGHTIHFLNIDLDLNQSETLKLITDNEYKLKINKNKFLIYQTLKSEIRKDKIKKTIGNIIKKIRNVLITKDVITFNINHNESVKYYYNNIGYYIDERALEGIIDYNIIIKNFKLKELYDIIKSELNILVYNLDSREQEQEQSNEKEKEKSHEKGQDIETNILYKLTIKCIIEYKEYPQFEDEFLNINSFKTKTIRINDKIRCLPNIFSQVNSYDFYNNSTGYLFVYIHEQILIIPGYLITHFNINPVLNSNLIVVNNIYVNKIIINELKVFELFKILNISNTLIPTSINLECFIAIIILISKETITLTQKQIMNLVINKVGYNIRESLNKTLRDVYDILINRLYEYSHTQDLLFIKIKDVDDYILKKYIKYKQKYIKFKNIIN